MPGLKWEEIGSRRPKNGKELQHFGLVDLLHRQVELSRAELDELNVPQLSYTSYIKVGDKYWKPTCQVSEIQLKCQNLRKELAAKQKILDEVFPCDHLSEYVSSTATIIMINSRL